MFLSHPVTTDGKLHVHLFFFNLVVANIISILKTEKLNKTGAGGNYDGGHIYQVTVGEGL
jgi:hypothetical protein